MWPGESCRFAAFKPIRRLRSPIEPPAAAATGRPSPRSGRGAGAELSVTATGVSAARGAQAQRVAHAEKVCAPTPRCDLRTAHDMRVDLNDTWHTRCVHVPNTRMNPRCDATHAWNARAYLDGCLYPTVSKAQTRSRPRAGADAARHGDPRQCFGGGAHALTAAQQHARSAGVRRQQAGAMNKKRAMKWELRSHFSKF